MPVVKRLVPIALLVAMTAASAFSAVGKTTSDPNSTNPPGSTRLTGQQLPRNVTCSEGGRRLHSVLEAVTASTGTKIRCGKNNSDWPVRDLPVDVYTRDVPLTKLLGWVAEASHLAILSTLIAQDKVINTSTFTIRRDKQGEQELQADEARSLAEASWTWDVFAKLGQEPNSNSAGDDNAKSQRLAAKIIASLPPDAKDKVISGEALLLDARSSPEAGLIRELVKATAGKGMSADFAVAMKNGSPEWSMKHGATLAIGQALVASQPDSDAKQTMLTIQLMDRGNKGASIVFVLSPMVFETLSFSYDYELKASDTDAERLSMPKRPISRSGDDPGYDCGASKRRFIVSAKDWDSPILQSKVRLDLPAGKCTCADVLSALAKVSGFSVVCEDYMTGRTGRDAAPKGVSTDTTVGAVLRTLDTCWFSVDEKDRVILGWAKNWRGHQRDLVPEKILSDTNAKIKGDGAELDDVTPLANLTMGQINEWLSGDRNKELASFATLLPNRMLWRIYDALSPEGRQRAKTPTGTSLAELDMETLRDDFRRLRRYDELTVTMRVSKTESEKQQATEECRAIASVLSDPTRLHGATLHIKSADLQPTPAALGKPLETGASNGHRYWMEIEFPASETGLTMHVDAGPTVFPIREQPTKP